MAEGLAQCSLCSKAYIMNKNLYNHMRKVHNVSPQLKGKILCPLNCEKTFRCHKDFRNHLEVFHDYKLENETQEFANFEVFEMWKKSFEETSGSKYVCHSSEKILKAGEGKTYFFCHRSGISKSDVTGLKSPKRCVSLKIGKTCPSAMEVSRSLANGTVKVDFLKTHIGHSADPEFTTPCKKNRTKKLENINFDVCAIIPAAGSGERMCQETPKQYIPIHQKPIICHTVDAFLRIPFIKKVVVVAGVDCVDQMLQTLSQMCTLDGDKLMITEGSTARHFSILCGLKALKSYCEVQPEIVIVHDGVRPFFPEDIVSKVVHAAKEYGAAGVTCPLVSTVISVDDKGFLDASLDRYKFKASEMPQAFQFDILAKAYEESSANDLEYGTECLHLVQKYADVRAKLLPVSSNLWKVTHQKDIYTATGVFKESQSVVVICKEQTSEFLPLLKDALGKTFKSVHSVAKFNVFTLGKYPNIVHVHKAENPYNVIEKMSSFQKVSELTSIVHVFINSCDPSVNFLEFQKQAKISAKVLKLANILVYFILREEMEPMDSVEELVGLVKSLLFESNAYSSGNVFLS